MAVTKKLFLQKNGLELLAETNTVPDSGVYVTFATSTFCGIYEKTSNLIIESVLMTQIQ
jgi:hypothetical protein